MIPPMADPSPRLVWVDLEMTGLDPETCTIVEIATIITDSHLATVAEGPCLVIRQPEEILAKMTPFVRDLHTKSGLLDRIKVSDVTLEDAAAQTTRFIEAHCVKGTPPLCGNSVWKDRAFLERYMPSVVGTLHYRMIDVSTVKEIVRRWYPNEFHAPKKREVHRALDDIRESIEELKWYRSKIFTPPPA
jgi:oligoribonuclease